MCLSFLAKYIECARSAGERTKFNQNYKVTLTMETIPDRLVQKYYLVFGSNRQKSRGANWLVGVEFVKFRK